MAGMLASLFVFVFMLFGLVLFLYVIIDIIRHEFTGYNKLIWIIVILCLPMLGAILYLIFGRSQRIKQD